MGQILSFQSSVHFYQVALIVLLESISQPSKTHTHSLVNMYQTTESCLLIVACMSTHFNWVRPSEWALHDDIWSCFCSDSDLLFWFWTWSTPESLFFLHQETSIKNSSHIRSLVYLLKGDPLSQDPQNVSVKQLKIPHRIFWKIHCT